MVRILLIIMLIESLYFNITFDLFLLVLLLLTTLSIGGFFPVRLKYIDKIFVKLAIGLGLFGFLIWLTTFYNYQYKSVYFVVSIILILIRRKHLFSDYKNLRRYFNLINQKNKFFLPIILSFLIFYLIPASYPIAQYDALAKHIAIPFKILNNYNWDYNVIEFIGYGDYALLPYMFYVYLIALGGTKAIVLFNALISFLTLFILIRISMSVYKSNFASHAISLIYLTTPLIYILSTILYVDILPPFFILSTILLVCNHRKISQNSYIISFILGSAFFAKQTAAFFVIPLGIILIFYLVKQAFFEKNQSGWKLFLTKIFGSAILFLVSFLPSMAVIWYKTGNPVFPFVNQIFKSTYFSQSNFADPFTNPLGLNINSLISMVFETSKNIELSNGGLGIFLFLLLLVPFVFFYRRNKLFISLFGLTIFTYYLSTLLTYNIRYMLSSIILAILICTLGLEYLLAFIKNINIKNMLCYSFLVLLIIPNLWFVFFSGYYWTFQKEMLQANSQLTINANESILSSINKSGIRVLANNDVFRGTFKGEYYTLDWYNIYLFQKLNNKQIVPLDFLTSFDYYLIDKKVPVSRYVPPKMFSLKNPEIAGVLTLIAETESHILYKVNRSSVITEILSEVFLQPINVTVNKPEIRIIKNEFTKYQIILEAEKSGEGEFWGRWQINWSNEHGKFISASLISFKLENQTQLYTSSIIESVPQKATTGLLYLTSHDEQPILIHSVKLLGLDNKSVLDHELQEYNKKWPHLSRN